MQQFAQNNTRMLNTIRNNTYGANEGFPFRMPNPNGTAHNAFRQHEDSESEESEEEDQESSFDEIGISSSIEPEQGSVNGQEQVPRRRRSGEEIQVLLETLRHLQPGRGSMPMPTSDQAPRFKGKNLRRFLDDYRIATTSAGWTDIERCANLASYCRSPIARFVRTLQPVINRDWPATVQALRNFYPSDEYKGKFKREDLERFVKKKHHITSQREFAEYYREFCRRTQALSVPITASDVNRMFWYGLPETLRQEVRFELLMRNPNLNKREAPSVSSIRKAVVELLDKESVFADPKLTKSKHRARHAKAEKAKHSKKPKKSRPLFDESESDDSDTEESDDETSESEKSDSSSSSSDSSSEDSGDERKRRKKSSSRLELKPKKKSDMSEPKSKSSNGKHSKARKESPADVDLGYPKGGVAELTDRIRELELMLGQATKPRPNVLEEFTRTMNLEEEPSNSRVMNMMKLIMKELEDHRNDTQILLDQKQALRRETNEVRLRCFFCKRGETHARGIINCPDAQTAAREGICIFQNGRIHMSDGSEMPRSRPGEGLLEVIRNQARAKSAMAAHGSGTRAPFMAFAEVVGPDGSCYDSDDEALDASPSLWHHVMAADRAEKTTERLNPLPPKKNVQWSNEKKYMDRRARPKPYVELPPPPRRDGPKRVATGPNAIPVRNQTNQDRTPGAIPETPTATEERTPKLPAPPPKPFKPVAKNPPATKENAPIILKQKPSIQKPEFAIKGDPRIPFPGPEKTIPRSAPRAKFQSKLSSKADVGAIYERVLGTGVTLPLGDLIAVSSELGRNLADDVRVRAMPVTKTTTKNEDEEMIDVFPAAYQEAETSDFEAEKSGPEPSSDEGYGNALRYESWRPRMVYAASNEQEAGPSLGKAVASTGCFILEIGSVGKVVAMVDSGAEMNIVTRDIAQGLRQHFAEDNSGKDYHLRTVSGSIQNLYAKFNDIPCLLGGFTLRQTFFESDDWMSHFQVILGQPFLRAYAADLSWKSEDGAAYMEMTLYLDGHKEGRSTTVRLFKRKGRDDVPQMTMALNAQLRQEVSEDEGFPDDRPSSDEDSQMGEEDTPSAANTENDSIDGETIQPDEMESRSGRGSPNAETEINSGPDHPWLGAIETMRMRYRLPRTKDRGLARMFNDAINDLRARIRPGETQLTLEEAEYIYARKRFRTRYDIMIGDRPLTATEGVQGFKIYNRPIHAVMMAKCSFNLMTRDTQRRLGLPVSVLPTPPFEPLAKDFPITVMYAADVPVDIGEGPFLPGFFLIVEDIVGRFDVMLGKPWLVGLEKRFEGYTFPSWYDHPRNRQRGLDGNSIIPTMRDLEAASSPADVLPVQEESESEADNAETEEDRTKPSKAEYSQSYQSKDSNRTIWARKRRRSESQEPPQRRPPGQAGKLGGSFGRTL